MTVNPVDRQRVAEALRALATGKITNDEYEHRIDSRSNDAGVNAVVEQSWFLYDDIREHRLKGPDSLSRDDRRAVARCLVFLQTDLEYEWPVRKPLVDLGLLILNLSTVGLLGFVLRRRWKSQRNSEFWPFARGADIETAIAQLPGAEAS